MRPSLSNAALLLATAVLQPGAFALDQTCSQNQSGVNVLVSSELAVSYSEGGLPSLPNGTRTMSYGPADSCDHFEGIIVVGTSRPPSIALSLRDADAD